MPESIHEHAADLIAAALADGLSADERRALDAHLAGCERCRTLHEELTATDTMLLQTFPAAVGPKPGFETRLVVGFRRREQGGAGARLRSLLAWLVRLPGARVAGAVAGLVVLVGLGRMLTSTVILTHSYKDEARVTELDSSPVVGEPVQELILPNTRRGPAPQSGVVGGVPRAIGQTEVAGQVESELPTSRTSVNETKEAARRDAADEDKFPGKDAKVSRQQDSAPDQVQQAGKASSAPTSDNRSSASGTSANAVDALLFGGEGKSPAPGIFSVAGVYVNPDTPGGGDTSATPPAPDTRKLIRNARAELEVASFEETVAALTAAAAQDGGFIDTQNSARGANGKLSGALVVKVLPENLDRFLARLRALGEVKNQTIKTEDITKAYFDTEARLRNSRRMEERLLKMLEEVKGKMSEVLAVEKEIARVRGDIEEMTGELKLYDAQVRFATLSLSVYEKDLHQPAAFLLRETATLALAAGDVERAAAEARRLAEAAHAQVLAADVQRDGAGHSTATLRLLLAPEAAPGVMAQLKALGRVENFDVQDERVAQNGADAANTGTLGPLGNELAKTERAPVSLAVTIRHDEQASREVSLTVVAPDVGAAFDKARDATTAGGGEVLRAETARPQEGHARATLSVRMPARADGPLLDSLITLGRVSDRQNRRGAGGSEDGPVFVTLTLTDAEPAAQHTSVRVRTPEVERRLAEIKAHAAAAGATVESSTFAREGDGSEQGALSFRLPLSAYPAFADRVRALGEVKDFTVRRQDRPGDAGASAEVSLTLYREGRTVGEAAGVGPTVRRTFGQGAGALMWSVQMIGVALAFLAPWAAVAGVVWGAAWLWRRRRRL